MTNWEKAREQVKREAAGPYKDTVIEIATSSVFLSGVREVMAREIDFDDLHQKHKIPPTLLPMIYHHVPAMLEAQDRDAQVMEANVVNLDELRRAA